MCAIVAEYVTQVTESTALSEPPGTHYPTCYIELPCTSQGLKFTDMATNFPCNFLQQGLGKLGAGSKCQTTSRDGVGLCFGSRTSTAQQTSLHPYLPPSCGSVWEMYPRFIPCIVPLIFKWRWLTSRMSSPPSHNMTVNLCSNNPWRD